MLYSNLGPILRAVPLLLCLTLVVQPAAAAAEGDDIATLKQQVRDLQMRVERLEKELEQGVPVNTARKIEPVPGGWRKAHNWKLLSQGMAGYEVKRILGEPDRQKTVKKFGYWYYGDGKVSIYMRRLKGWDVPSGVETEE